MQLLDALTQLFRAIAQHFYQRIHPSKNTLSNFSKITELRGVGGSALYQGKLAINKEATFSLELKVLKQRERKTDNAYYTHWIGFWYNYKTTSRNFIILDSKFNFSVPSYFSEEKVAIYLIDLLAKEIIETSQIQEIRISTVLEPINTKLLFKSGKLSQEWWHQAISSIFRYITRKRND